MPRREGTTKGVRRRWRAAAAVLGATALACAAVLPAAAASGARRHRAPKGLPGFYAVPRPLPKGRPGTLLRSAKVPAPGVHGTAYRVMYLSTSARGRRIAVTGVVIVPDAPAPRGGYPVVTWGHGTNGMADTCAPSLQPADAVPLVNDLLDQGWEVTASDYQGEGTPGLLPYLVGDVAARNTIDVVRAARHLRAAHASANYVAWGHSEGGQTAMFTLHIAPSYGRGLHMRGVVAGAPPSQFSLIYDFLQTSPYRYYLFMAAVGFNVAYGDSAAPLRQVLTPEALALRPVLSKGCAGEVEKAVDQYSLKALVKRNPFELKKWRKLLKENDPASFDRASPAPLLMIQGGDDQQIPVASTQLLATHLCKVGQTLQRWIYPGQSHAGVIVPSMGDMVHWIADRFAGDPVPDAYAPTGVPGVEATACGA